MNERICEIARECKINVDPIFPGGWPNEQVIVVDLFAKAIIQECSHVIQDFVDHRFPASEYPERLRKYFGVTK